jgi:hypothetical protein
MHLDREFAAARELTKFVGDNSFVGLAPLWRSRCGAVFLTASEGSDRAFFLAVFSMISTFSSGAREGSG